MGIYGMEQTTNPEFLGLNIAKTFFICFRFKKVGVVGFVTSSFLKIVLSRQRHNEYNVARMGIHTDIIQNNSYKIVHTK